MLFLARWRLSCLRPKTTFDVEAATREGCTKKLLISSGDVWFSSSLSLVSRSSAVALSFAGVVVGYPQGGGSYAGKLGAFIALLSSASGTEVALPV